MSLTTKTEELEASVVRSGDGPMTTDQGIGIPHTDDSLKAGQRGSTLLEDFHLREKITRFDHERIPERVVHARGAGAHGTFQVYRPLAEYTRADFLNDPARVTPVFVRFSTVVGSRGSADTVRDTRGFAVKFYTAEGNYDLVGNNIPVFFIQDGIKFPDVIHAVKPEPHNEIPQAQSAHDTFWDFVSLQPETTHHTLWNMSDRGIPRSLRMMEGFGVHTFRLVAADGSTRLVKFHWKPLLGVHGLAWDEAQEIAGRDPDFHRRDLWDAIDRGAFPQWELGFQIVEEADVLAYGFDLLDATKLLPEELVPVQRVGLLTLDRNPVDYFAEVEQVAFHVAHVVPGIDFTEDPLLQARLFSYLDTQLTRLGGPNFHQLPINRTLVPVSNHQQDGIHQHMIKDRRADYHPNTIEQGCPALSPDGFVHVPAPLTGYKTRERSETFLDHFSQPAMFVESLSDPERDHLTEALRFELGKVTRADIRERVINDILVHVDPILAEDVGRAIGVEVAAPSEPRRAGTGRAPMSPALSMLNTPHDSIATRKVAVLITHGVHSADVTALQEALGSSGAVVDLIAGSLSHVVGDDGSIFVPTASLLTTSSVLYDAVVVPGGADSVDALSHFAVVGQFVRDAWRHCKPLGFAGGSASLLAAQLPARTSIDHPGVAIQDPWLGVVEADVVDDAFLDQFQDALRLHRVWARQVPDPIPPVARARPAAASEAEPMANA